MNITKYILSVWLYPWLSIFGTQIFHRRETIKLVMNSLLISFSVKKDVPAYRYVHTHTHA